MNRFQGKRAITEFAWPSLAVGLLFLALPAMAHGATISGQITNGTTGRPVANQQVQVLSPRGGMSVVVAIKTDSRGKFVLHDDQIDPNGFYLLQATYDGVDYHAPIKFDSGGNASASVTIYESTGKLPGLQASSARILVKAEGSTAHVQELFALQNPLQKAYRNSNGTFAFHIPPQVGTPTVAVAGLMNMPLPQVAENGKNPGDYYINYALKPGLTVVMVAYDADYGSGKLRLDGSIPLTIGRIELFVSPPTLKVDSAKFQPLGEDSDTDSRTYVADGLAANQPLGIELSGEAAAPSSEAENSQGQQGQVKRVPDSAAAIGIPILLCFLLVLLWALGIRVSKEWPRWKARQKGSPVQKKFRAQLDAILNSMADLDELLAAGKVPEKQYWRERLELKAKAIAIMKEGPKSKPDAARAAHQ